MKLYAYVLRSNIYTKDKSFHTAELEVRECPMTYVITGEIPKDLYIPSRILKSDVNGLVKNSYYPGKIVVLDHPDLETAKRLFFEFYGERIREYKSKIKRLESVVEIINDYKEGKDA